MLVPFPDTPAPATIEWTIDQPGQVNRGEFTGKRRVTLLTAAPRWFAKVTLPPILGEERVLAWRRFVVDCDGIANSFRLVACERPQTSADLAVRVRGGGQGGHRIVTAGWGGAGAKLRAGQFVTIADQLLLLTQPAVADSDGVATLTVKPYLRFASVDGALVEVRLPYAVMAMSDPKTGWKVGIGQNYAIGFDCEEAF